MTADDLRPPSSHLVVGDTCPGTTCFTCPGTTCLAATVFGFAYHVAQGVKVQFVCCAAGNHSGSGFAPPRLLRTTTGLTAKPYFAQHYSADDVTTSRSTAKAKCLCRLCARAPVDLVTQHPGTATRESASSHHGLIHSVTDSNATGSQRTPPVEQPKPLGGNATFGHTGDYPQPAKQPPVPPRHWRYPAQDCLAFRDHSAPGALSPESTRRRLMRTRDSDVCGTMIIGGATIKRHSKPWAWPPCPVPGMPDPKSPCMWKFHPHRSVRSHDPPSQYEDMISRGLSHSRQGIAHRC
ncbi:hypothetical protein Bbelb_265460 [Branchiostoma belcheri]|nr:hypothetical protein Bbelb_265460 [Branchiostoma belcheri]